MAAVCLAIVGKNNEPLYVREFFPEHERQDAEDEAVLFGLKPLSTNNHQEVSSKSLFSVHAALDRLDQLTKTLDGKKKPVKGSNKSNNFVGMLLPFEETRAYGYVTNTQTKIIIFVEDEGPTEAEATEADTLQLLEEIHELYVREVMNPFHSYATCSTGNKPVSASNQLSQKFDERILKHIGNFNQPEIRCSVAEC